MTLRALIVALVLLSSCTARHHLKRARYHMNKAEALGAEITKDTTFQAVTVEIPTVRVDTVVQLKPQDTLRIVQDRLKIKIVRLPGDSIRVKGDCEGEVKTVEVPTYIETKIETGYGLRHLIGISIFWLVVGFLLGMLRQSRK